MRKALITGGPGFIGSHLGFHEFDCFDPPCAVYHGFVDRPGPRKVHGTPMPVLGGLAMHTAAGLAIVLFIESSAQSQTIGILGGATLLASMGIVDDAGKLHHQVKLRLGMPLAGIILIASGIHVTLFPLAWLNYGITLLWVVGIVCAFNLLDNMDGLCAGVASIASVFSFCSQS